jgi:hypothetical protein
MRDNARSARRRIAASAARTIASGKPITSVTIFTLIEQGRIKPTDKVFGPGAITRTDYESAAVQRGPCGRVLAVTAGFQSDDSVRTFAAQSNGLLKEGPGSPFKASRQSGLSGTVGFSWSADGRRIMVTNFRGSAIRVFSVDPKTAALRPEGEPYSNHQRAMCWAVLAPDGKSSKSRLEAENAALRQQLIALQRKVRGRARFTDSDRLFFIQLYRSVGSLANVVGLFHWQLMAVRRIVFWKFESSQPSHAVPGKLGTTCDSGVSPPCGFLTTRTISRTPGRVGRPAPARGCATIKKCARSCARARRTCRFTRRRASVGCF